MPKLLRLATAAVAALMLGLVPAHAQAPTEGGVEEVVVTARKQSENLRDVPLSVTALGGEGLEAILASGADLTVLSARAPGVNIESSFGRTFPRAYIRGLGNTDFDLNAAQPVSFVYDEVVFENPVLKGFPLFDIGQVEVLRGPQGTLFGRNTPAGVIKFDSVAPQAEFGGYARLTGRTLDGFEAEGAIGGPLGGGVLARLSGLYNRQDDWVENAVLGEAGDVGGFEDLAGRLQLAFGGDGPFRARVNIHGRDFEGGSQPFQANAVRTGSNDLAPGFSRDRVFADAGANTVQELTTWGVTTKFEADFGFAALTSVTGYETIEFFSRGDVDGGFGAAFAPPSGPGLIPFPAETADGVRDHSQWSQELRLTGAAGPRVDWLVGAYYFDEDLTIDSFSYDTLAGGALNGVAEQTQETEAWALFASATVRPAPALALTAGVRYSDEEKDFVGRRTVSPIGAGALAPIRVSVGDQAVSWDLSAVWTVRPEVNLYGRVARGFRAPAIQGRLLFGDSVTTADSEFVTSYEVGVKGATADRRFSGALALFAYEVEDQQLTAIGGAGNFNQLLNAEEGQAFGFEAEAAWAPISALTFTAAVGYTDTEIKDPTRTVAPCGAPCTVLDPVLPASAGGGARIDGNRFPNAPEWTANLTARYEAPLAGDGGRVYALTDWTYKGETNFFLYDSIEFVEDGYWEGGVRVGYLSPTGRTEVAAFVRNVTDEVARQGAIDFNNLSGFVNQPRIWGVTLNQRF